MAKDDNSNAAAPATASNAIAKLSALAGGISLLAIVAGMLYLILVFLPAQNQQHIQQASTQLAVERGRLIAHQMNRWQAQLAAIADLDTVLDAFDQRDASQLAQLERQFRRAFPEAVSLRLIPLGQLGIAGLRGEQVRNNIEMDMLRTVSGGDQAAPEAYRHEGRWLVSLAQSASREQNNYASGALLLTVSADYLQQLLPAGDAALGHMQLAQLYLEQQQTLISTGPAGDERYGASVTFGDERWQLRFTPTQEQASRYRVPVTIPWLLLAGLALAALIAMLLTIRLISAALSRNLAQLTETKPGAFTLPGFAEAQRQWLLRLKKALASAPAGTAEKEKTKPAAPAPEVKAEPAQPEMEVTTLDAPVDVPDVIFRAYDIRGLAEQELTDRVVETIGRAFGSEALDRGEQTVLVACDGRLSSPRIRESLIKGLLATGRDVVDIGLVPTPVLYFATHQLGAATGVMITGSHNPAEYNGMKMVIGNQTLSGEAIQDLKRRIQRQDFASGQGEYRQESADQQYIDYIINDVAVAQPLKIVIDAGSGATGEIAPRLFEALGCEVLPLHCEIDGNFPHHHPDPTVAANLQDLIERVREQEADLGIAFDGDGDRVGVISGSGQIVPADRLLMLLAQDVVSRNPGADVLFDVKCTRHLNSLISSYGGRPIMWKSGHSFMKDKMAETGALLGGEYSGHIFFNERWFGFDDGMYAAARLVEILSTTDPDLDVHLEAFPSTLSTPEIKIETGDVRKFEIIEKLGAQSDFGEGKVSLLDGVRVDFQDGWGLVRASNTTPALTLRFEAEDADALTRIQEQFKQQLSAVEPDLAFGF